MARVNRAFCVLTLCILFAILATSSAQAGCLLTPVPGTTITSNFGLRFHPVYKRWKPHRGTDMRASMRTKVFASHDGQVIYAGWLGGGGNTVKLQGADGVMTDYLHLSKPLVKIGQTVNAGELIGLSGNSGHSSIAPHLHFQTHASGGSRLVDPRTMLCEHLPEKPGAGPDQQSPDGYPAPNGGTVFDAFNPAASYVGMSVADIMKTEAEKRFLNSDWYLRVEQCGADADATQPETNAQFGDCKLALMQEYLQLLQARSWMRYQKSLIVERINGLNAGRASIFARQATKEKISSERATLISN